MRRAKRYAHCHFAHSSRWDCGKRSIFWTSANVAIFRTEAGGAKRYAHCHFRDSTVLKQHFNDLTTIENRSRVNIANHMSKQNNQNKCAKHVKICTCKIQWKISTLEGMKKKVLSKMNENPAQKVQVMLRTAHMKTKLLKFNWFTSHFWSLENRLCAAPWDPSHQTRRAKRKNSGQESQVKNRALAGEKRGRKLGTAKNH